MSKLDQFESVFKSATKPVFHHRDVALKKVLVVTDLDQDRAAALTERVGGFLSTLGGAEFVPVAGDRTDTVAALLALVEEEKPDVICTYRSLHSEAWQWPHSLGRHLDVLTQATEPPVLIIPHPEAKRELEHALKNTDRVMAITDHLTTEERLINFGLALTQPGGKLWLTHVEDQATFERYIDVISRIPLIDTDQAEVEIRKRLMKEPRDYIASCKRVLAEAGAKVEVAEEVVMGKRINEYKRLIASHEIDLLVMNAKDHDQLAMHGMAYPLAVELREIPLLML